MSTLEEAIDAIRMGDQEGGRQILEDILEADESNEDVWLWLSSVVDNDEDREICLENVLALNPDNIVAQKGLEALRSGTFNVHDMMGDALEERNDYQEPATFLEDFAIGDDFDEDDELVMPSTMGGQSSTKSGGGLNIRLLILVGLIIVVLFLAAGGVAVSLFLGDGNGSGEEVPGGGNGQPVEAVETDTPTPLPTDTPTVTSTPFELPTIPPTPEPTPTATPVVQPTVQ